MAVSLKEYNPAASELKRLHKTSVDGKSNTTKFPARKQPARASLSAHLFTSLKIWLTLKR